MNNFNNLAHLAGRIMLLMMLLLMPFLLIITTSKAEGIIETIIKSNILLYYSYALSAITLYGVYLKLQILTKSTTITQLENKGYQVNLLRTSTIMQVILGVIMIVMTSFLIIQSVNAEISPTIKSKPIQIMSFITALVYYALHEFINFKIDEYAD